MSSSPAEYSITPPRDVYRDRRPPYSEEAETAVIAAMLMDQDAILRAAEHVDDTMFYREQNRRMFRAMISISERGEVVDPLTLAEELSRRGELEAGGGKERIGELIDAVPTSANVEYHAKIVKEKALQRRLIETCTALVGEAFEGKTTAAELLDDAEHRIFQVSQQRGMQGFTRIKELMWPTMERIEALQRGGKTITGVASGFNDLDEMTSGFQPADLIIVAARPSMGKCLAHDSEIVLEDGSIATIEEIYGGRRARLLTLDDRWKFSLTQPSAFVDDGIKPVFRVTTRLGRTIETTLTHPFRAIDGWRPLGELAVGDRVAVPRVVNVFGNAALRECEVKLLAYLLGDGCVTGSSSPRFTNGDERVLAEFESAVAEFGGVTTVRDHTPDRTTTVRVRRDAGFVRRERSRLGASLRRAMHARGTTGRALASAVGVSPASVSHWASGRGVPSPDAFTNLCAALGTEAETLAPAGHAAIHGRVPNPLAKWLEELGLWGCDAHEKFIPPSVFTLPRDQMALFLNRLFATDGWATVLTTGQAQLGFASVSERLARQVQHLLLRFGIIASLRSRQVLYRGERRPVWQLDITDSRAIRAFAREIGIFSKEAALDRANQVASGKRYQTNRDLIPIGVWDRIAAAKRGASWASLSRQLGHGEGADLHVGSRMPSRARLARFAAALDDEGLADLASSDVYWDEIVSIEPMGMKQVYDLTIPETHNFVANDVCVHNTAFILNVAQYAAIEKKTPVAIFSLEMSKESLVQRMLTAEARVDAQKLRKGMLRDDDFPRMARAAGILSSAPIWIDDAAGITLLEIRSKARRLKADSDIGMVVVDYLQLIQGPASSESRQQEISQISRSLKMLAKELGVPVVALSQLSRAPEQRAGDHRPQLSDLRESGAIEQDADLVMFIYRQEVYDGPVDKDGNSLEGRAEIIIGKQRNGPIGTANLFFHKSYTRFENYTSRPSDQ